MDRQRVAPPPLVLVFLLLSTAAAPSLAQVTNGTSHHDSSKTAGGFTPTTVIVLVVLIGALVVLTLFSVYTNRCAPPRPPPPRRPAALDHYHHHQDHDHAVSRARGGLDRDLVESFPTAVYADVKARAGAAAGPLECAVCLAEFDDRDELRVLPACFHVFHPACIDPWLAAAVTCPLCRADLTAAAAAAESGGGDSSTVPEEDDVVVGAAFTPESLVGFGGMRPHELHHYRRTQSAMDVPDRHTLRLPEHVMKELAAVRRHRRAASLAGYPDAVERTTTPRWLPSFWRSVSWQRHSRTDTDAGEEHNGGSKRVVPITEAPAEESASGSGSGGDDKEKPVTDALNRV